jgi:hypothetical protein
MRRDQTRVALVTHGSQPPIGASGVMPQSREIAQNVVSRGPWILN